MEHYPQCENEALLLPTPSQLHKLSTVALAAANWANRLKYYTDRFEPVYGWVEAYHYDDNEQDRRYERYSGRRARRVFAMPDGETQCESVEFYEDRWSLRYREIKQQYVMGDFWLSELKTYAFEWDSDEVSLSLCQTKVVPSLEQSEVDRVLALNDEEFDDLSMVATDAGTAIVDQQQVGLLTGSIRKRSATIEKPESRSEIRRRTVLRRLAARHQYDLGNGGEG